jgi:hypothetical protein
VTRSPFQTAIADWNMIDKLGSQCDLLRVRIPSIKTQVTLIKERCEEFGRETKVIAATSSHSPEVCNVQQSVECGISCRVISLIASTLLDNETPRLEALNSFCPSLSCKKCGDDFILERIGTATKGQCT